LSLLESFHDFTFGFFFLYQEPTSALGLRVKDFPLSNLPGVIFSVFSFFRHTVVFLLLTCFVSCLFSSTKWLFILIFLPGLPREEAAPVVKPRFSRHSDIVPEGGQDLLFVRTIDLAVCNAVYRGDVRKSGIDCFSSSQLPTSKWSVSDALQAIFRYLRLRSILFPALRPDCMSMMDRCISWVGSKDALFVLDMVACLRSSVGAPGDADESLCDHSGTQQFQFECRDRYDDRMKKAASVRSPAKRARSSNSSSNASSKTEWSLPSKYRDACVQSRSCFAFHSPSGCSEQSPHSHTTSKGSAIQVEHCCPLCLSDGGSNQHAWGDCPDSRKSK
jgi:hypothetical protein